MEAVARLMSGIHGDATTQRLYDAMDTLAEYRFNRFRGVVGPDSPDMDEIRALIRADVRGAPSELLVERGFQMILAACYSTLSEIVKMEAEQPTIDTPAERARARTWLETQRYTALDAALAIEKQRVREQAIEGSAGAPE